MPNRCPKKIPKMPIWNKFDHSTIPRLSSIWLEAARRVLPVVVAQPASKDKNRATQVRVDIVKRRSDTESFPTSRTDVDILRRDILAKASLILIKRRAVTRRGVIFNKLHLFFFPHRIQCPAGVVTLFTANLFCDTVTCQGLPASCNRASNNAYHGASRCFKRPPSRARIGATLSNPSFA